MDIVIIVTEVKMLKQVWFNIELAMSDRLQNFVKSLNFHHHHPSVYEAGFRNAAFKKGDGKSLKV